MKPMPYRKLRRIFMKGLGGSSAAPRKAPERPRGLDKRLPAARAGELRALGTPDEQNWERVCDLHAAIVDSLRAELEAIDTESDWYERLSPVRRAVMLAWNLEAEVNNGGFDQFYLNSSGDGAAATPEAMRQLGLPQVAAMVEKANAVFEGGPPISREARLAAMDRLSEEASGVWSELDREFFALELPFGMTAASIKLILENEAEFFMES